MGETIDLTLLNSLMQEMQRDLRLLKLQGDNTASRIASLEQRQTFSDQRLATIEQSIHELIGEMARGFGQMEQRFTRNEQRLNAVDAGLTRLRESLAEATAEIVRELKTLRT